MKITRLPSFASALLLILCNVHPLTTQAAPGGLDSTFGGTGKVRTGFGGGHSDGFAIAVQSDGKLIMAGSSNPLYPSPEGAEFAIARLDTNGIPDASFGNAGVVTTGVSKSPSASANAAANAVKIQLDGKIVAAGFSGQSNGYSDFTVVRYLTDGSLDLTFGTNGTGIVRTDFGEGTEIRAMAIQSDGRIVVAGYTRHPANAGQGAVALARYQTNGTLDVSFGTGGKQITTGVSGYTGAHGVMIQSDGKIVAVGIGIGPGHNGIDFATYRYTTNGVLDTATFGGGTGKVFTQISTNNSGYSDQANGVATQFGNFTGQNPDRIVVSGYYRAGQPSYAGFFALTRYNLDGTLDTSFGNGGIVTNTIPFTPGVFNGSFGQALFVQGVLNQPRKITVAGYSRLGTTNSFTVARYNNNGTFDNTFGGGTGYVVLSFGAGRDDTATSMVFAGGKVVVAGSSLVKGTHRVFSAVRLNADGSPDGTFGNNGIATVEVSNLKSQAKAVAIQTDGKVVAAGSARDSEHDRFALARYNQDGSLDSSFGFNGKVTTVVNSNDLANAVALQTDGKIVAAGTANGYFAVVRYNTNGILDSSFNGTGKTTALLGTGDGHANAVQIQTDGKIIAAGHAQDGVSSYAQFALARFNTNGTLDTTFGNAGKVITSFNLTSFANAAGVQSNGKIILAGLVASVSNSTAHYDFALSRYNTNGALDFTFGSLGRTSHDISGGTLDTGYAMALQPDGKIIVAGSAAIGANAYVALARFNTNGAIDSSFGSGGSVITQIGASSDYATALTLQTDGKIVIAGSSQNLNYRFFAQRYHSNGSVDNLFGGGAAFVDFGTGTNEYAYGLALDSLGRVVIAGEAGGIFGVTRLDGDLAGSVSLSVAYTTTNTVVISWPYPSVGWNLQQKMNLNDLTWSAPSEAINNNGTDNFIIVTLPTGSRFYRLLKP